jgi:hypothetical protein
MPTLTHKEISKLYPSVGRMIAEGRSIVKNSMPRELVKNVRIEPPKSIIPGTPQPSLAYATLDKQKPPAAPVAGSNTPEYARAYAQALAAHHSAERMEQAPPEDPSIAILRCFGGKTQKNGVDSNSRAYAALVCNRWKAN